MTTAISGWMLSMQPLRFGSPLPANRFPPSVRYSCSIPQPREKKFGDAGRYSKTPLDPGYAVVFQYCQPLQKGTIPPADPAIPVSGDSKSEGDPLHISFQHSQDQIVIGIDGVVEVVQPNLFKDFFPHVEPSVRIRYLFVFPLIQFLFCNRLCFRIDLSVLSHPGNTSVIVDVAGILIGSVCNF